MRCYSGSDTGNLQLVVEMVAEVLGFKISKKRRQKLNGIGTALIKAALQRYKDVRQIELATDNRPETVAFY